MQTESKALIALALIAASFVVAVSAKAESMNGDDKKMHAGLSFAGAFAVSAVTTHKRAALACLLIGGGKELIYDKAMHRGQPSWKDFAADAVGCVSGAALGHAVFVKPMRGGVVIGTSFQVPQ